MMPMTQLEALIRIVAVLVDIPHEQVVRGHKGRASTARQLVCWVAVRGLGLGFSELARHFNLHHTTVMYGISKLKKVRAQYPQWRRLIDDLDALVARYDAREAWRLITDKHGVERITLDLKLTSVAQPVRSVIHGEQFYERNRAKRRMALTVQEQNERFARAMREAHP